MQQGSHYSVGVLLHGVQQAATTIDAISKIELILDNIKEQANVRLNGKTVTREHDAIRDSLSHNIGKIAATAVMNFINRKVTIVF
ncbi:hypothetical protein [Rickettsia helvetica]|uniref:Methyl-accepting transducer domain-containing protein n=1 Tax=Rickettsia helvetica TaxID=35789 RepID=A0ABM9NBJ2_RICHE|nr:hypothetical protein [Rickettsia helvetica]MCZ6896332.1 hypothetical protein [Rickettsia endosymbiont of Ixodes ricinus]